MALSFESLFGADSREARAGCIHLAKFVTLVTVFLEKS